MEKVATATGLSAASAAPEIRTNAASKPPIQVFMICPIS
jgi:hypothetical protein